MFLVLFDSLVNGADIEEDGWPAGLSIVDDDIWDSINLDSTSHIDQNTADKQRHVD